MKTEEKRIYVAVAATIQTPVSQGMRSAPLRTVIQPVGRQIAQACHVVSKLRHEQKINPVQTVSELAADVFIPITTIILQARDSAELEHVWYILNRKKLNPVTFSDENPEYGPGEWPTAIAVLATKKQIVGALDYLPLWPGSK